MNSKEFSETAENCPCSLCREARKVARIAARHRIAEPSVPFGDTTPAPAGPPEPARAVPRLPVVPASERES